MNEHKDTGKEKMKGKVSIACTAFLAVSSPVAGAKPVFLSAQGPIAVARDGSSAVVLGHVVPVNKVKVIGASTSDLAWEVGVGSLGKVYSAADGTPQYLLIDRNHQYVTGSSEVVVA
jgi:hypothetical protein